MCLVLLTMTSPQHRQSNSGPTMRECLLADSSPVPYPLPRAPMAPLCVCAAPMRPCMSPWPLAIPVDGPTAWLRSTWMASSKRSRRSSMRLCCRVKGQKEIRNLPKCSFKLGFFCAGHLKTLRNKTAFYHLWWVIRESGKIRFGVNWPMITGVLVYVCAHQRVQWSLVVWRWCSLPAIPRPDGWTGS